MRDRRGPARIGLAEFFCRLRFPYPIILSKNLVKT